MHPFLSRVTSSGASIKRFGISVHHKSKLKTPKFSAGPLHFRNIWSIVLQMKHAKG